MNKNINAIATDVYGVSLPAASVALMEWNADEAAATDNDAIMETVNGATKAQVITEGLNNPPCVRSVNVTVGGTASDVKAGVISVYGTNYADEEIHEDFEISVSGGTIGFPAGSKAFKTITKVVIPEMNGTGCTIKVGTGNLLGLPYKFSEAPLFLATVGGSADAGTINISADNLESNTYQSNASIAGTAVKLALVI